MSLTADEREVVISFTDAEELAHVYTSNRGWITKLTRNPSAVLLDEGIHDGSRWAEFEVPKALLTIRSKRGKRAPLSEEHKAKLAAGRKAAVTG